MRTFEKSHKLDYVCYDIRGPVMDEAQRMAAQGMEILKLNIGNPAPFGFRAPDKIIEKLSENLTIRKDIRIPKDCRRQGKLF